MCLESVMRFFPSAHPGDISRTLLPRPWIRSRFTYVPFLLEENLERVAENFLEDIRAGGMGAARQAEQKVKAGFILEMGGKAREAADLRSKVVRHDPEKECCFFAGLAQALLSGKEDRLEAMPSPVQVTGEIL